MTYLLKDIVKLPEKKGLSTLDALGKEGSMSDGFNQAIDEIGNIPVEIDVEKVITKIKDDLYYDFPNSYTSNTKIIAWQSIVDKVAKKFSKAIASNFKELIKC